MDFDLAVQGVSLADVRLRLEDAIEDYVIAANAEAEATRQLLLHRRAPIWTRIYWALRFYTAPFFARNLGSDSVERFPVACHA